MRRGIVIVAAVLALLSGMVLVSGESDASGDRLLIDCGNGDCEWFDGVSGQTYGDVLASVKGGCPTDPAVIDGLGRTETSGLQTVVCEWHIFSWDGKSWVPEGTDFSSAYEGGDIAFGYYPDGMRPAADPGSPTVWTQMGGNSSSEAVSDSEGPESPVLPVEWYRVYDRSYVDSSLVSAGDMLYFTTAGVYGKLGDEGRPMLHCLDRFTGETVWTYLAPMGEGYEVTTPLIVGDYVIMSFTNGDMSVFDRVTGEVTDTVHFDFEPPYGEDKEILWEGRIFTTGSTTPVYDSGAVYFALADGRIMCYALSPEGRLSEVWCHTPEVGVRGCFYFHAPTMADIDGERRLFIGSYEGYMHCLDASDGSVVWERRVIDMRDVNQDGTPGSACTATVSPDGSTLVVTCTDGAMIPSYGYALFMDPRTGEVLRNDDGSDRMLGAMMNKPVVTDDGFYTFVVELAVGSDTLKKTDGTEIPVTNGVYKFDWEGRVVWASDYYNNFKGQLTLAGGRIYGMDYSAGVAVTFPGGCVTVLDAEDGREIDRLLLRPCTETSYSMSSVLVVDGKLYTGNDMGAVYCISDVAGPGTEEEWMETLETVGFHHWSWAVLLIVTLLAILIAYRLY